MGDGISVIVPIYNTRMEYLVKCVESILNQTYSNIEILLLNDGSTNNEIRIFLNNCLKKDSRIKVINKENSGVSSTRNLGIKKANKEWIMFVDADDYLTPNACKNLIEETDIEVDVVISKNYIINLNNVITEINNKGQHNKIINTDNEKKELINSIFYDQNTTYHYVDTPWAKLYKRDFIINNEIKFKEDLKMAEDTLFNFEAFLKAKKISYIHLPTYYYRKNEDSVSNSINYSIIENYKKVFKYYQEQFDNYNNIDFYDEYNYFVYRQIRNLMKRYFFNKQNEKKTKKLKEEMKEFLNYPVCKYALNNVNTKKMNTKNRIICATIKTNSYILIKPIFILKERK